LSDWKAALQPLTIPSSEEAWEMLWSPYSRTTYRAVLEKINPCDTVLEIGAGDLRLSRHIAAVAQKVYAIEIQDWILANAVEKPLPENLIVISGDARQVRFPTDVTLAVLLMRHCRHYGLYSQKLKAAGCQRLITNARWRYEPELVDLQAARRLYSDLEIGWYACSCGATGFKSGPVEELTQEIAVRIYEVANCPRCPATTTVRTLIMVQS
jgi:hypothetical protein